MNDLQIKYFLKAAQRLNFSEAAKELFITQPALSQQITVIEKELNMQLFIRDKNKLRLTPAATVLMQELPDCTRRFQEIITRARTINEGYSGSLKIGVLEGQILPPNFRALYHAFLETYPNVYIELYSRSFAGLRAGLDSREVDVALTINVDIKDCAAYLSVKTDPDDCVILAAASHPIVERGICGWKDLKDEVIILVDNDESASVGAIVKEDCRQAGFTPNLRLVPSLNEQTLWIDAGMGVGISNSGTYISVNPNIRCLKRIPLDGTYFVTAWHRENINSTIPLFTNFAASYIAEHGLL